jgi:hypothetical protein
VTWRSVLAHIGVKYFSEALDIRAIVHTTNFGGNKMPKQTKNAIDIMESMMSSESVQRAWIKANSKKHKTVKERLAEFYGADFNQNTIEPKELDWGKPVGKEV